MSQGSTFSQLYFRIGVSACPIPLEEGDKVFRGLVGGLFRQEVTAGQGGPFDRLEMRAPDGRHIVKLADQPLCPPKRQKRHRAQCAFVRTVVIEVNTRRGAVILAGGVNAGGVGKAADVFGQRRIAKGAWIALASSAQLAGKVETGIGPDQRLGKRGGLDQGKPVLVGCGERPVGSLVHVKCRRDIENGDN